MVAFFPRLRNSQAQPKYVGRCKEKKEERKLRGTTKYMNHYHYRTKSIIYSLIIDPQHDQLPAGVIAQLVERCTGIAEVRA